jgi:hypothetical protein
LLRIAEPGPVGLLADNIGNFYKSNVLVGPDVEIIIGNRNRIDGKFYGWDSFAAL